MRHKYTSHKSNFFYCTLTSSVMMIFTSSNIVYAQQIHHEKIKPAVNTNNDTDNNLDKRILDLGKSTVVAARSSLQAEDTHPLAQGNKVSDVVIYGEAFDKRSANLGDALAEESGVHANPFGGGASNPIIRGQEGVRVKILQNDLDVADMSHLSPDHASATDTLLADKVQLMRGASTLMYASHSTAGVVNVVDKRIPTEVPDDSEKVSYEGQVGLRYNTNNNEKVVTAGVTTGLKLAEDTHVAVRVEGLKRKADNYHVPEINLGEKLDYVPDTYNQSQVITLGLSLLNDDTGHIGVSYSKREDEYGLPGHNHKFDKCSAHIYGIRENSLEPRRYLIPYPHLMDSTDLVTYPHFHCDNDHENDPTHSHDSPFGHDHDHTHKGPWVMLDSKRIDLRGELKQPLQGIEKLKLSYAHTDYYHDERDPGKIIDNEGNTVYSDTFYGTAVNAFNNRGHNAKLELYHAPIYGIKGVVGAQYQTHETIAKLPKQLGLGLNYPLIPNDIAQFSLFLLEQYKYNDVLFEFGARAEKQTIAINYDDAILDRFLNPDKYCQLICTIIATQKSQVPDLSNHEKTAISVAGTVLWDIVNTEDSKYQASLSYSHNERVPSPMELYYHGKHLATNSFEYGNKDLKKESSNNVEIGLLHENKTFDYGVSTYFNDFDNYIFNQTLYRQNNLYMRRYTQSKARIYGVEGKFHYKLNENHKVSLFGDYIRGKLYDLPQVRKDVPTGETDADGNAIVEPAWVAQADRNAPRMPPARIGIRWQGSYADNWESAFELKHAFQQNDVAPLENKTHGYTMLNMGVDYRSIYGDYDYHLFLNANNLLDEKVYVHTSFLPFVPQMGRSFLLGLNVDF